MRPPSVRWIAPALLVLAACGGDRQLRLPAAEIADLEIVKPAVTRALEADDGTLLSARDVVADAGALFILDGSSEEVWRLSLEPPHGLTRVSRPRRFGQTAVFAMSAHAAGLSLIGVDGVLRVMDPDDPDQMSRTIRAFASLHRPLALGEWQDLHWVTVHAVTVLREEAVDSVIVSSVSPAGAVTRVYGYERAGKSRADAFMADPMSARVVDGRVVLVGADPARVITVGPGSVRVDTLLDAPVRDLNASERSGLQRMLEDPRLPASLRRARLPERRPAAIDALPFAGGYAVVAQGGEEARFLDLYCGQSFRRTLLSRAGVNEIFVVDGGVVAIDDPPLTNAERPERLSFFRSQDFIAECNK